MAILKIFGDWKGAREALNGVARHAKKVNAQIKSSFSGFKSFFSKVFIPLGFVLGSLGITTVFTQIVNKLDAIGKSSANMGVSVEYFQKMNFAAERTETSIDQVREAFAKVLALVGKFMTGDKNAAGIMGQLGLTREDLAGLNAEQTFDKVNRALRGIGDEQTRNAVAATLYGETFQKLNNFLRDYVDLGEEAQSRGLIVSDETIKAAERLKDVMTNAGTAFMAGVAKSGMVNFLDRIVQEWEAAAQYQGQLNKTGVFDRKRAVEYAIAEAEASGQYTPQQIAKMEQAQTSYALRRRTPMLYGAYELIDKALTDIGWKSMARLDKSNWGTTEIADIRELTKFQDELRRVTSSVSDLTAEESRYIGMATSIEDIETRRNKILQDRFDKIKATNAAAEAALKAEQEAEAEANKKSEEYIENLKKQLRYQQLIYQGKGKEAAIEKQLEAARAKASGTLSPEREAEIRRLAGQMYDLQHPEQAAASGAVALSSRIAEYPTDALRRIGGYSGAFNSSNPSLNYQRQSAASLSSIKTGVEDLNRKITGDTGEMRAP